MPLEEELLPGSPDGKMPYGFAQVAFRQTRPDPHSEFSPHVRGHGPTAFAGADVYSIRESIAQKISTGRPSQPQRPPGSMHEGVPLGTMHLPLLLQPNVKPQRWPEGHSASFVQLAAACGLALELVAPAVCACMFPNAATSHAIKTRLRTIVNVSHNY
jgi:hypothetical protein